MFLERAGNTLANADSNILQAEETLKEARMQRVRRQEELEAGQARLETLRTESTSSFGLHSHPVSGGGSDQGAQITSLQQIVIQLQAERDAFAEKLQEQEGVQNQWGRSHGCGIISLSTHARQQEMIEAVSQGSAHDISRVAELLTQGAAQLKQWSTSAEFVSASMLANKVD